MKKSILLILILYLSVIIQAQTFDLLWTNKNNVTNNDDRARQNVLDSSAIYIVGNDYSPGNNQWRIEKHNKFTGDTIWTKTVNPSNGNDYAMDVNLYNGSLYITGYENVSGTDYQWRIEKRDAKTGNLIWVKTSNPSIEGDVIKGSCVNDSGLFVVGSDYVQSKLEWRIERRNLNTGDLVWYKTTDPSTTGSSAQAYQVVANSNAIYICGSDAGIGNVQWHIEKRSISTGDSIWTKVINYSSGIDYSQDLVVDRSGLYIVGSDCSLSTTNSQIRIEKRDLINGDTIWTKTNNPTSLNDYGYTITQDSNFIYIGCNVRISSSDVAWLIEKRSKSTGQLICSQETNPSSSTGDNLTCLSVDNTGVYLSGHDVISTGDFEWHIKKYDLCVTQSPPIADFTFSSDTIYIGEYINLIENSTNNPIAWFWNFTEGNPANSMEQNPSNIYFNTDGIFSVQLLAANGGGLDSISKSITVLTSTKIQEEKMVSSINIYPNPTSDVFQVTGFEGMSTLNLYDITGQLVFTKIITTDEIVSIGSLPQGMYVVELVTGSNSIWDGKMVKL